MSDEEKDGTTRGTVVREARTDTDPLGIRRRRGGRKRAPGFTKEEGFSFDYKDPQQLKYFINDRGKINPRRVTGLSAAQQRELTIAVKRARHLALLPYTTSK